MQVLYQFCVLHQEPLLDQESFLSAADWDVLFDFEAVCGLRLFAYRAGHTSFQLEALQWKVVKPLQ